MEPLGDKGLILSGRTTQQFFLGLYLRKEAYLCVSLENYMAFDYAF